MELGDIWLKVARNQGLTPQEEEFLRLAGKQTQMNNSFISGMKTGESSISVSRITGNIADFVEVNTGLAVKVKTTTLQEVTSGGGGIIDCVYTSAVYDDSAFFNLSTPTRLTMPLTGRYVVIARAYWEASAAAGTRQALVYKNGSTSIGIWNTVQNDSGSSRAALCFAYGEVTFNKGDYITLQLGQFTGSALDCVDSYLGARLIRKADDETSTGT